MGQIFQRTYKAKDGTVKTCETWTLRYYRNGKPYQEATKFKKGQKGKAKRLLGCGKATSLTESPSRRPRCG